MVNGDATESIRRVRDYSLVDLRIGDVEYCYWRWKYQQLLAVALMIDRNFNDARRVIEHGRTCAPVGARLRCMVSFSLWQARGVFEDLQHELDAWESGNLEIEGKPVSEDVARWTHLGGLAWYM